MNSSMNKQNMKLSDQDFNAYYLYKGKKFYTFLRNMPILYKHLSEGTSAMFYKMFYECHACRLEMQEMCILSVFFFVRNLQSVV